MLNLNFHITIVFMLNVLNSKKKIVKIDGIIPKLWI